MNTFGRLFRISIFGESHGESIGVLIDGCPPGIALQISDFFEDIQRRKSGTKGTTTRKEDDIPQLLSGVFEGYTTGAPICISFRNENTNSGDYSTVRVIPRPGHADFVANKKFYGFNDLRGGGHFSGRLTLALVAAGVIAKKIISPVSIQAKILEVGGSDNFEKAIEKAVQNSDSIGGIVECRVSGLPVGLGEPFFDSVESVISHLVFSIPAVKGIEFGLGFESAKRYGSEVNDPFIDEFGKTSLNNSGGINGGISNGNEIVFRIAVKPASSIGKTQQTFNFKNEVIDELSINGRHDACIALRVPPVLEAVTAIGMADLLLVNKCY
jgi:chorismate synthase